MVNPAALRIVDQMMGDHEISLDARAAARRLLAVALVVAIPVGGVALIDAHRASGAEALSAAFERVGAAHQLAHAAHADGVASGLLIGGVHVPAELTDRIAAMVESDLISGARQLTEARLSGLEAALSGGWTTERLEAYVSRIETTDPDLGRIITEETGRLSGAGVPEEQGRALLRAMAVRLMSGEPPETPRRPGAGSDADRIGILDQAQTRLWARLEETGRVGGLDHALTRDLAVSLIALALAPAPEPGPASP